MKVGPCNRPERGRALFNRLQDLSPVTKGKGGSTRLHQGKSAPEADSPIQVAVRQRLFLRTEKGWQTSASSRLSKLEQMDSAEQVPSPLDPRPHSQHRRKDAVHEIRRSMGIQQYSHQARRRMEGRLQDQ